MGDLSGLVVTSRVVRQHDTELESALLTMELHMELGQLCPVAHVGGRRVVLDVDIAIRLQVPLAELERVCEVAHVGSTAGAIVDLTPTETMVIAYQKAQQGLWKQGQTPVRGFTATGLALLLHAYQRSESLSNKILDVITGAYASPAVFRSIH